MITRIAAKLLVFLLAFTLSLPYPIPVVLAQAQSGSPENASSRPGEGGEGPSGDYHTGMEGSPENASVSQAEAAAETASTEAAEAAANAMDAAGAAQDAASRGDTAGAAAAAAEAQSAAAAAGAAADRAGQEAGHANSTTANSAATTAAQAADAAAKAAAGASIISEATSKGLAGGLNMDATVACGCITGNRTGEHQTLEAMTQAESAVAVGERATGAVTALTDSAFNSRWGATTVPNINQAMSFSRQALNPTPFSQQTPAFSGGNRPSITNALAPVANVASTQSLGQLNQPAAPNNFSLANAVQTTVNPIAQAYSDYGESRNQSNRDYFAAQHNEYSRGRAIAEAQLRMDEALSIQASVIAKGNAATDRELALEAAANDRVAAERATIATLLDTSMPIADRVNAALAQEKATVSENYARDIVAAYDRGDVTSANQLAAAWTERSNEFETALNGTREQKANSANLLGVNPQNSLIDNYNRAQYGLAQISQRDQPAVQEAERTIASLRELSNFSDYELSTVYGIGGGRTEVQTQIATQEAIKDAAAKTFDAAANNTVTNQAVAALAQEKAAALQDLSEQISAAGAKANGDFREVESIAQQYDIISRGFDSSIARATSDQTFAQVVLDDYGAKAYAAVDKKLGLVQEAPTQTGPVQQPTNVDMLDVGLKAQGIDPNGFWGMVNRVFNPLNNYAYLNAGLKDRGISLWGITPLDLVPFVSAREASLKADAQGYIASQLGIKEGVTSINSITYDGLKSAGKSAAGWGYVIDGVTTIAGGFIGALGKSTSAVARQADEVIGLGIASGRLSKEAADVVAITLGKQVDEAQLAPTVIAEGRLGTMANPNGVAITVGDDLPTSLPQISVTPDDVTDISISGSATGRQGFSMSDMVTYNRDTNAVTITSPANAITVQAGRVADDTRNAVAVNPTRTTDELPGKAADDIATPPSSNVSRGTAANDDIPGAISPNNSPVVTSINGEVVGAVQSGRTAPVAANSIVDVVPAPVAPAVIAAREAVAETVTSPASRVVQAVTAVAMLATSNGTAFAKLGDNITEALTTAKTSYVQSIDNAALNSPAMTTGNTAARSAIDPNVVPTTAAPSANAPIAIATNAGSLSITINPDRIVEAVRSVIPTNIAVRSTTITVGPTASPSTAASPSPTTIQPTDTSPVQSPTAVAVQSPSPTTVSTVPQSITQPVSLQTIGSQLENQINQLGQQVEGAANRVGQTVVQFEQNVERAANSTDGRVGQTIDRAFDRFSNFLEGISGGRLSLAPDNQPTPSVQPAPSSPASSVNLPDTAPVPTTAPRGDTPATAAQPISPASPVAQPVSTVATTPEAPTVTVQATRIQGDGGDLTYSKLVPGDSGIQRVEILDVIPVTPATNLVTGGAVVGEIPSNLQTAAGARNFSLSNPAEVAALGFVYEIAGPSRTAIVNAFKQNPDFSTLSDDVLAEVGGILGAIAGEAARTSRTLAEQIAFPNYLTSVTVNGRAFDTLSDPDVREALSALASGLLDGSISNSRGLGVTAPVPNANHFLTLGLYNSSSKPSWAAQLANPTVIGPARAPTVVGFIPREINPAAQGSRGIVAQSPALMSPTLMPNTTGTIVTVSVQPSALIGVPIAQAIPDNVGNTLGGTAATVSPAERVASAAADTMKIIAEPSYLIVDIVDEILGRAPGTSRQIPAAITPTDAIPASNSVVPVNTVPVQTGGVNIVQPEGLRYHTTIKNVDPRLPAIMEEAAKRFPLRVALFSGQAGRSSGLHNAGKAVDIIIFDDAGKPIASYMVSETANIYALFAETARQVQKEMYPELDDLFVWGGSFTGMVQTPGGRATYGGGDFMDFRIGGGGYVTTNGMQAYKFGEGWQPGYEYYTKDDFLGIGTRATTEADYAKLAGFRLSDEQNKVQTDKSKAGAVTARGLSAFNSGLLKHPNIGERQTPTPTVAPDAAQIADATPPAQIVDDAEANTTNGAPSQTASFDPDNAIVPATPNYAEVPGVSRGTGINPVANTETGIIGRTLAWIGLPVAMLIGALDSAFGQEQPDLVTTLPVPNSGQTPNGGNGVPAGGTSPYVSGLNPSGNYGNGVNNLSIASSTDENVDVVEVLVQVDADSGEIYFETTGIYDDGVYYDNSYNQNEDHPDAYIGEDTEEPSIIIDSTTGQVTFSDGTFAPVIIDGVWYETENDPRYVYAVEIWDDGKLVAQPENISSLPSDGVFGFVAKLLDRANSFNENDMYGSTRALIDPNPNVEADEYYAYRIYLRNGEEREITVPQFTSYQFMTERFASIGYEGDVMFLVANAVDIIPAAPSESLLSKVVETFKNIGITILDVFRGDSDEQGGVSTNFGDLIPSDDGLLTMEDIKSVTVITGVEAECPTTFDLDEPYLYELVIDSRSLANSVSDEAFRAVLCGGGEKANYVTQIATHLETFEGVGEIDRNKLSNLIRFGRFEDIDFDKLYKQTAEPTTSTTEPPTSTEDQTPVENTVPSGDQAFRPNLTNTISFEVKVVDSSGGTVRDWSSESVSINTGEQLYFRWDGTDYQQCLPFLNDNGNYALTVANRAMVTGNTESGGYNVSERSAVYRIECGGQRNNEFGVDSKEINVTVE